MDKNNYENIWKDMRCDEQTRKHPETTNIELACGKLNIATAFPN